MSAADKSKLDGVATGANNYSHPTGDGNLHVPATSTTSNGKVLKAGTTAGSLAWGEIAWSDIIGKPSTYLPSAHVHMIADVTGLQSALDGKSATNHTHAIVTTAAAGFMNASDKSKLDGISANANRVTNPATNGVIAIDGVNTTIYSHPNGDGNSHVPATGTTNDGKFLKSGATANSATWQTIMADDVSGLQALLEEKSDAAHGHALATTSVAGFLAAADKTKLDSISSGAQPNQNTFSIIKVGATNVVADTTTDTLELIAGTNISLSPNATNDSITITNSTPDATTSVSGLMSSTDKAKLDGVAANANNYVHPATHPPSIIAQDATNRFVTDVEKNGWNAKASTAVATTSVNGLMSSSDKTKLDGIATNANNYSHPSGDGSLHVPATGTTNGGKFLEAGSTAGSLQWANIDWTDVFNKPTTFTPSAHVHAIADVTGLQAALDSKSATSHTHANATTSVSGFMATADKTKLDGISTGANRITNPATNGVIAIDGVNTTVYAHPTGDGNLHVPATSTTNNGKFLKAGSTAGSIAWQSASISDVTGLQTELDAKSDAGHGHSVATTSANGFMASTDKAKLDGIAAGAQTNQNAFSNVKVGATTIAADLATDTFE
ncbi:hypothetical protein, partial [Exiguobacterium chiriqhucha]|uniref:hypothetical protein n=1 Tax=Exiguobacterium chiriqhucha TaxID=1385984 RepID=UPI0023F2D8EE